MTTLYDFFAQNGFAFELLAVTILYTHRLDRRPRFPLRFAGSAAAMVGASMLCGLLPAGVLANILCCLLLFGVCLGGMHLCLRIHLNQGLFYLTCACVTQHLAFRAALVCTRLLDLCGPLPPFVSQYGYAALVVPFLLGFYALFAAQLRGTRPEELHSGSMLMLSTGMILCVNIFSNLITVLVPAGDMPLTLTLSLFDMVTSVFLLFLQVELARAQTVQQDNALLRQFMGQQKRQLEVSRETIDLINIKCHDIKNQISTLGSRLPPEEVDDLNRLTDIYDTALHTGCEPLDVLLCEKLLLCRSRSIRVDCMVDGAALNAMRPADVYALFGNAMDNAMEAVLPIVEPERRWIALQVRRDKGMILIHVENEFNGTRTFADGLPCTTKDDRANHGFGMKSIRLIAQRYGGYLSCKTEGSVFALNLLLPQMAQSAE